MRQNGKNRWLGGLLVIFSGILRVLSFPPVRNYLWKRMVKGGEKIVDAKVKEIK